MSPTLPSHLLVELASLSQLNYPSSSHERVHFSSIAASPRHLLAGSTKGAVYIFKRYAPKGTNVIPPVAKLQLKTMGLVNGLCINQDETQAIAATSDGLVCLIDMNKQSAIYADNVCASVTAVIFGENDAYAGDEHGNLFVIRYSPILGGGIKQVLHADSTIVQLDSSTTNAHSDVILVSTMTRSHVYNAGTHSCHSLGSSSHKRAALGAVFASSHNCQTAYVARPKGRLWEAAVDDGQVYSTHKFNNIARPPCARLIVAEENPSDLHPTPFAQPKEECQLNFTKLFTIRHGAEQYVISWHEKDIYVIEPSRAQLKLVCKLDDPLWSICTVANDVFLLTTEGNLHKLTLLEYGRAAEALHVRGAVRQAVTLIRANVEHEWRPAFLQEVLHSMSEGQLGNNDKDAPYVASMLGIAEEREEGRKKLNESQSICDSNETCDDSSLERSDKVFLQSLGAVQLQRARRIRRRSNSLPSSPPIAPSSSNLHGSDSNIRHTSAQNNDDISTVTQHIHLVDEPFDYYEEVISKLPTAPSVRRKGMKRVKSLVKSRRSSTNNMQSPKGISPVGESESSQEAAHRLNCHVPKSWIDDARRLRFTNSGSNCEEYLRTFEDYLEGRNLLEGRVCLACRRVIRTTHTDEVNHVKKNSFVDHSLFDQRRGSIDVTKERTPIRNPLENVEQQTILRVFSPVQTPPPVLSKMDVDIREEDDQDEDDIDRGSSNKLSNDILRLLISNVTRQGGGAALLHAISKTLRTADNPTEEVDQILSIVLDVFRSQPTHSVQQLSSELLAAIRQDVGMVTTESDTPTTVASNTPVVGFTVSLDSDCTHCHLPLRLTADEANDHGVFVMPTCGHVYHAMCSSSTVCEQCNITMVAAGTRS